MAQERALFAVMEQQHAEQRQRYIDLEQVLDRTAQDFEQLREDHQKAIDELRLLRRWIYAKLSEILRSAIQYLFEISVPLPLFGVLLLQLLGVLLFHHGEQSPFLRHQPMALSKVAGKGK